MHLRRTDELHSHRWSQAAPTYFVTCCTRDRRQGLTASPGSNSFVAAVEASDASGDTATLAFTVMPDHVHWLFTLGSRLPLGSVIGRWKMGTRFAMRAANLAWQRDYFEHRLRPDEAGESYALYILLNPYRAGLVSPSEAWAYWFCPAPERFRFAAQLTPGGGIPAEWVSDRVPAGLATGE